MGGRRTLLAVSTRSETALGTTAYPSSVPQRSAAHPLLVCARRPLEPSPITPRPGSGFYTGLAFAACLCAPFWAIVAVVLYFLTQ